MKFSGFFYILSLTVEATMKIMDLSDVDGNWVILDTYLLHQICEWTQNTLENAGEFQISIQHHR